MVWDDKVEWPTKKSEYEIRFASGSAQRGWTDLRATIRGPLADTRNFLTHTPLVHTPTNYPLRGSLGIVFREGRTTPVGSTS